MSSSARIDELRRKFDENPRRYFAPLANEYRKAGDFDQAIFICQEYLPQQPGHMSGHIVFGQALFEAKRLPEARIVFETALSLDPENLIALRHLADISRDMGETAAARGWYERVLQADPRNEEIAAIMTSLGAAGTAPAVVATTEEVPIPAPAAPPAAIAPSRPQAASASAPTVELSAAAVQEMLRARQAAKQPEQPPKPAPAKLTLDDASTVELNTGKEASPLDGLEATSHEPTPEVLTMETLGLETNAAPGETSDPGVRHASPVLEGLDTLSLDEISLPGMGSTPPAPPAPAPTPEPAATSGDGLLDLESFSFGAPPEPAKPASSPAAETPIDGGPEGGAELMDFDLPSAPSAPPTPEPSVPTLVMDAIETPVPMVMDAAETAVPSVMEAVETTVPAVVDAVMNMPTLIMEAIRVEPPKAPEPAPFVTETMAQLYLSQGHRAEAIEIYRQLIAGRPNDAELRARFEAIEQGGRQKAVDAEPIVSATPAAKMPPRFTGTGPSIRAVLRDLFGIDGNAASGTASSNGAPQGEAGSIDILFATESVADALSPLAVAFDGGYVATSGNIDELFAGGDQ